MNHWMTLVALIVNTHLALEELSNYMSGDSLIPSKDRYCLLNGSTTQFYVDLLVKILRRMSWYRCF